MPETFSAITIETFVSNAWYNLTPDVKHNPPPRVSGMGGLGFSIIDRVIAITTLSKLVDFHRYLTVR